jgi:putative transposase
LQKKKRYPLEKRPLTRPTECNKVWCLDFIQDRLSNVRKFRILNVEDVFTREHLEADVAHSIGGERVTRVLDILIVTRGRPEEILSDNGPELTSLALQRWCMKNRVFHHFIEPGKPTQNTFVESLNGKMRDEFINLHIFQDLEEVRKMTEN